MERFAADWERQADAQTLPEIAPSTGRKVAVVGAGPAGLTCAGELAKLGHQPTIFEALHEAGGVLIYGIPEFRLPKDILAAEVHFLERLGVEIRTNYVVGQLDTVDELLADGHQAVFVGTGAGLPRFMGIEGDNLMGVCSANEFLTRANLMRAYRFPEYDTPLYVGDNVAVVGGGNVAMDAIRCAKRLGAKRAMVIYRRSREEMPARIEEIHHAEEEGIELMLLTNPIRWIGDSHGWLRGAVCQRMELGEPDDSGRRRPVPIEGSEFELELDVAVVSIGTSAHPLVLRTTRDLHLNKYGYVMVDEMTGMTNRAGIFAGGDIVTGSATVIEAMGAGKRAALGIHEFLGH